MSASQRCVSAAEADDVRVIEVMAPRSGGCSRWSNILGWDVCLRDWGLRFLWIEAGDIFLRGPGLEVSEVRKRERERGDSSSLLE